MIRTHSTHPDEEDDGPFKWISPGDTKVITVIVLLKLSLNRQWKPIGFTDVKTAIYFRPFAFRRQLGQPNATATFYS
jgi:hypothetical protein